MVFSSEHEAIKVPECRRFLVRSKELYSFGISLLSHLKMQSRLCLDVLTGLFSLVSYSEKSPSSRLMKKTHLKRP